jgi:hypothetical protein
MRHENGFVSLLSILIIIVLLYAYIKLSTLGVFRERNTVHTISPSETNQNRQVIYQSPTQATDSNSPPPRFVQPCLAATEKVNPTDDRETYINSTYSYKIKYPPKWMTSTSRTGNYDKITISSPDLKFSEDSGYPTHGASITILAEKSHLKNIDELYKQIADEGFVKVNSRKTIYFNGIEAMLIELGGLEIPFEENTLVSTVKDGYRYTISFGETGGADYIKIFEGVVCSFTFSE